MRKETVTYRLCTYDLWGNEEDGYEVNDVRSTSVTVEVEMNLDTDYPVDEDKLFADLGVSADEVEIDGSVAPSLEVIYFVSAVDSCTPAFALRKE